MLSASSCPDEHCVGLNYEVTDIEALAKSVALVLLQEFSIARQLATDSAAELPRLALEQSNVNEIIARRLHPKDSYHRDGLVFQLMMWLASHMDLCKDDLVALPHSQGSAKGQDSIIVHRARGQVVALTVCEDKATENPRNKISQEVWPEIKGYESGNRSDELRSSVIATLGTGGVASNEAEELIRGICWTGKRRYRVRVTIEKERSANLFVGFAECVGGAHLMRRGETALIPNLRSWMNTFVKRIEAHLHSFVGAQP